MKDPVVRDTPSVVARPRLYERLSLARVATLVSAPAGSGKTSLLRSWIDGDALSDRAAWVTVERDERDAQRFWLSLIDELRASVGPESFDEISPTPNFNGTALVERLISQLSSLEKPVVLVIDDLEELRSSEANGQLELLLARRPSPLRIILAARRDPHLGLHRLRLAGQLTEIRASDLRFTLEETRELLAASQITLSETSVAALHERTEGWAAGLRLATLSLAADADPERFVAEFSGNERTVADYLLAEVLENQPDEVRRLLVRTSILQRVNGPLADLLTGGSGSEGILHTLERSNAFVVAQDAERSWFRYHSLFADLLRLELRRTESHLVKGLHKRAADWYLRHGLVLEAIRHSQAAEDWNTAARAIADHGFSLYLRGQGLTVQALLAGFPAETLSDPELTLLSAYEPLASGRLEDVAAYVTFAEHHASVVAPERRHAFEVELGLVRLALARRRGDLRSVLDEQQTLGGLLELRTPSEAALSKDARAFALMNLGVAELWSSMAEDAERHLLQARELAQEVGAPFIEVGCLAHLALLTGVSHSLTVAQQQSLEAIALAEAHGWASDAIVGVAYVQVAGNQIIQGRFEDAECWLERADRALRPAVDAAATLLLYLMHAMVHIAERHYERALEALRSAEKLQTQLIAPHWLNFYVRSLIAQTLVRLGDTARARAILAGIEGADRRWVESHVAVALLHLAEDDAKSALGELAPALGGSAPMITRTAIVQAALLAALASDQLGDRAAAESYVERALELAESAGLVYPFVVTPVQPLLERHPRHRTAHASLLSDVLDVLAGSTLGRRPGERSQLREDLTESELRILRRLPSHLSAPEIGRELYLSTSTVKTHMHHIYGKLGVHRRVEAVDRARELGLLAPSARRQ